MLRIRQMSKCSNIAARALLLAVSASLMLPALGFAHVLPGPRDQLRPHVLREAHIDRALMVEFR